MGIGAELFDKYTDLRQSLSKKIAKADKVILRHEIKKLAISIVEGVQKEGLSTQSTELSPKSVVIPVENVGEVEKSVTDVALEELVNNYTEEKELVNSVIKNIDDNSIFSAFPPVNGKIMSGEGITLEMLNGCVDALKPTESLIVRKLENSTYHAANWYSSTQIRLVQRGGIGALEWYKNAPCKGRQGAFLIGTAVHTAILEQESFTLQYVSAPELDLRTKDGKQALAEFESQAVANNQIVLKKDDFEQIKLMRDSALAYPLVAELLENGEPELSIFYRTEKGTLLKIRTDWLGLYSGVPFILDVKTTDDVHDFGKSVDKFGYHLQAAFYQIIAQKVFNLDIDFLFCAIGKRPECGRYPVQLGMLDEEDSEEGAIQVNHVIDTLENEEEPQTFSMISRPFWAKQADRKRREALLAVEGGVA